MRAHRWPWLLLLALAGACASSSAARPAPASAPVIEEEETDDASLPRLPRPELLKWVPADTPYFFGALTPLDAGYAAREYLTRLAAYEPVRPAIERMTRQSPRDAARIGFLVRLEVALLAELGGQATPEKLAGIGLDPATVGALYGLGMSPVVRIQLSDPARFTAALNRMAARLQPIERAALGGQRYYAARDESVVWILAVAGRDLVVALIQASERNTVLPILLGQRPPERSLATSRRLDRLAAEYGLGPAGLGYADMSRWAATLGGALGGTCAEELAGLAAAVPRVVIGLTRADGEEMKARSVIELRADLIATVQGLRGEVPRLDPAGARPPLEIAVAVDMGRLIAGAGGAADRLRASPYRCAALAWMNDLVRDKGTLALSKSIWSHIRGVNLTVQNLEDLTRAEVFFLVGTDRPGEVLDAITSNLRLPRPPLEPGGPPAPLTVALPPGLQGTSLQAALGRRAVGISLRAEPARLTEILAADVLADPPLLALHLDPQPVLTILQALGAFATDPRIAAVDADLARTLAAIDRTEVGRYDDLSVTARATAKGIEVELDGRYPK